MTWLILSSVDPSIGALSQDIPDSDPFFPDYGPSFELSVTQGLRPNLNSTQEMDDILEQAFGNLAFSVFINNF